jgi:transcriptional regulator with XRE-family HTH domain
LATRRNGRKIIHVCKNGYANIERDETDVKISRLQQIANVFEMDLLELFNFSEKNVVYFSGDFSSNGSNSNGSSINNYFSDKELQHELEKIAIKIGEFTVKIGAS